MSSKLVLIMSLTVVLVGMLGMAVRVQKVEASGTIYIRADGSIEPLTVNITSLDNTTYTFTDSNYDEIVVERNDIIIDGNDYTLQGSGAYDSKGIDLSSRSNVTVKDMTIRNFYDGIYLSSTNKATLINNSITNNYNDGIRLTGSFNNTIIGNNITNNDWQGIVLGWSSNNSIAGNNITNNDWHGIELWGSSDNNVTANTFFNGGLIVYDSYGNVVFGNLVNDKPLVYLEGVENRSVEDAGQIILVNCNNIHMENLDLSHTDIGVQLCGTHNTTIIGNHITANNDDGIRLFDSSNYNSLFGNNVSANNGTGIFLFGSSNYNSVTGNNITNNMDGIFVFGSFNNTITANNIANNEFGIRLGYYSSNNIYHNNLIDNTQQADLTESFDNVWDDGYPSGGNYWSNYNGTDLFHGSNQNITGSDGVGDSPYVIDYSNNDSYPLMASITLFHAGTWNGTAHSVQTVSNSTISDFSFSTIHRMVSFNVTGSEGIIGFSRVGIPKRLLYSPNPMNWVARVNGTLVPFRVLEEIEGDYTYIYFTYSHSILNVQIIGTEVISEFPSLMILPLFMMVTLLTAVIYRRKSKP